ncbi:MAG: tRNA glutamyl-Q(34) synthetase GluQRS [Luteimonas sp.]
MNTPASAAAPTTPRRGRFAPSPTGPLHAGSLLAALGSWLLARAAGGEWLVRIEDLDPPRELAGTATAHLQALAAFGLSSDQPVLWQSGRDQAYRAALEQLLADGSAFHCHCSRADLASRGGIHRRCVSGAIRKDPSVRLRVPDGTIVAFEDAIQGPFSQDVAREVGDFVLRRADGWWAYQFAVVVDDGAQGISDVARGADLLDSTPRQMLLQAALGLPTPAYAHLSLLVDRDGRKLAKSLAALPVDPAQPLPVLAALWGALGQERHALAAARSTPELLHAALKSFDPAAIPRGPLSFPAASHNTDGASHA